MTMRGALLVVLGCGLATAGCAREAATAADGTGSSSASSASASASATATDCNALGEKMAELVAKQLLPTPTAEQPTEVQQTTDQVRAVIAEACTLDRWSDAMARCGLRAAPTEDCARLLTVEQRHGLQTRIMQVFVPPPAP